MSELTPFLTAIAAPTRAFAAALPVHPTPEAMSPWTPKPTPPAIAVLAASDLTSELEAERLRAAELGREAGQRETDELRDRLGKLIARVEEARATHAARVADLVADAALAVIEAWFDRGVADRRELFLPIVRGWLQRTGDGGGAIAYVHPDDVAAMRGAVGDALIGVEADVKLARGDVRVRGTDLDITHQWQHRLAELRDAIATATELATPELAP